MNMELLFENFLEVILRKSPKWFQKRKSAPQHVQYILLQID